MRIGFNKNSLKNIETRYYKSFQIDLSYKNHVSKFCKVAQSFFYEIC